MGRPFTRHYEAPLPVSDRRPNTPEDRISFLEGEVECLQFLLAVIVQRMGGKSAAVKLADFELPDSSIKNTGSPYQEGYLHSFRRLRNEINHNLKY